MSFQQSKKHRCPAMLLYFCMRVISALSMHYSPNSKAEFLFQFLDRREQSRQYLLSISWQRFCSHWHLPSASALASGPEMVRLVTLLHVTRLTSHVTRQTSHVTRHTSHVTRPTSHVTRHTSHVTRHRSVGFPTISSSAAVFAKLVQVFMGLGVKWKFVSGSYIR